MIWSLEIEPHIYGQLIFNKGAEAIQQEKYNFPQTVLGQLETHRKKSEPQLLPTSTVSRIYKEGVNTGFNT